MKKIIINISDVKYFADEHIFYRWVQVVDGLIIRADQFSPVISIFQIWPVYQNADILKNIFPVTDFIPTKACIHQNVITNF